MFFCLSYSFKGKRTFGCRTCFSFSLFGGSSRSRSSAAIICLCIKPVHRGTSVHGSCWLRDLCRAFRGNQQTKPSVTDGQIGLFAPLLCTCVALKPARCVSLAISRGYDWWSQSSRRVQWVGGMGNLVNCMVKEEIPKGECVAEALIILVPDKFC